MIEIILLERVEHLGQMGDVVRVRPGYARNFLLPQHKALRATKANLSYFETRKAQLEAENLQRREEAEQVAERLNGMVCTLVRAASAAGQLYGSASARDVAAAVTEEGVTIDRTQVLIETPIKQLGLYEVRVRLHPEVSMPVTVNVARSLDEAAQQLERGGAITEADRAREADQEALEELEAELAEAQAENEEMLAAAEQDDA